MKMENGTGTVYKRKGRHHRPWQAVITSGWEIKDGKATQKRKLIGSYATKTEALEALMDYRKDPALIESGVTFAEIYDRWAETGLQKVTAARNLEAGYRYCAALHQMQFSRIRAAHIEAALKDYNFNAQKRARTLLNHLYRYAMKNDIVQQNYAASADLEAPQEIKRKRAPFTASEIARIKEHTGEQIADMILIQIYSGWRPAELLTYQLKDGYMVGGSKTEAGKNRVVPVHPEIADLVEKYRDGFGFSYVLYWERFKTFMAALGMDHIPHECRHTFATFAKRSGMDEYAIKKIMGHASGDLTEDVYTHRSIEDLAREMQKFSVGYPSATGVLPSQNKAV